MRLSHSTCAIWVLAIAAILLTAFTTLHETRRWRKAPFADFNNLQTGGECLVDRCDPYDFAALNREAALRHERKPDVWPMSPVYPTSSIIVLLPFQGLGWPTAAYLFNALAGLATAIACALLILSLRIRPWDPAALPLLASLLCIPIVTAIEFANPALLDAALIAIACVLLLQSRLRTLGWIILGVTLALKPQLAIGAAIVLFWRRQTRVAALKSGALALALLVLGIGAYRLRLGSFHFLDSLRYALWLSAMPGGLADFANHESWDFLNLQVTFAAIPAISRAAVETLAWLTAASLAAAALLIAPSRSAVEKRPWTMIALATAISLLPIYHRGYDRVIALLLVPAAVELAHSSKRFAWLYAALLALWIANDTIMSHIVRRWLYMPQSPVEDSLFCAVMLAGLLFLPPRRASPIPASSPLHIHPFDRIHGTDTSGLMLTGDPALTANSGAYTSVYLGISPSTLRQALAQLDLQLDRFTFVDIGCGKGRALLVASEFPFPKLLGVEFSPELCAIATANLARLPQAAARTTVLLQDATAFIFPQGPLLLFLYDSFRDDILPGFLTNLEAQLTAAPRELWILYAANGLTGTVARFPFLELIYDRQLPLSPEDAEIDQRAFNLQFPPGAGGRPRQRITHEHYTLYRSRL